MNIRDILTIYDDNSWATHQILDAECAWCMLLKHNTLAYFDAMKEEGFPTLTTIWLVMSAT